MSLKNNFVNKFGSNFLFRLTSRDSVKFIHASDLHLGAAQYRNQYRADDFIQAFQEILEFSFQLFL